jgi:hypothetical protein
MEARSLIHWCQGATLGEYKHPKPEHSPYLFRDRGPIPPGNFSHIKILPRQSPRSNRTSAIRISSTTTITMSTTESKGKGASKTGTEDKYKWLAAIVKHSDITSVDWSLVCEEVGCPESTMLKRWQTVRNEVLPGLTVKKMKGGDIGTPKSKAKGKGAAQAEGDAGGKAGKRKGNAKGAGSQKKKVKIEAEGEGETFTDEEEVGDAGAEGEGEVITYDQEDGEEED